MENKQIQQMTTIQVTPKQANWVKLADYKANTEQELQKSVLDIQGKVNTVLQQTDLDAAEKLSKSVAAAMSELSEKRLEFTNKIKSALIDPFMNIEKGAKSEYDKVAPHILELKNKRKKEVEEQNRKLQLRHDFKFELTQIETKAISEYKKTLYKIANDAYSLCLETGEVFSANDVELLIFGGEPVKFTREKVTGEKFAEIPNEEKNAIFNEVKKDTTANIEQTKCEVIEYLKTLESSFQIDIKNKEVAKNNIETQIKQIEADTDAVNWGNILAAESTKVVIDAPKIKQIFTPITENTPEWWLAVNQELVKIPNWALEFKNIKDWGNITLYQMAKVVADYHKKEKVGGLTFKISEK
jgi:RNA polymerase-binding transcription factor DksA